MVRCIWLQIHRIADGTNRASGRWMTLNVQSEQGFLSDDETGLVIGDEMIEGSWTR